jgi:hypothetical protein
VSGEEGRIQLSWEPYSGIGEKCKGCTDPLFVGELVCLLNINDLKLRLHESCISQLAMTLVAFVETTEDIRNGVTERQN